ncbi:MAG: hypothetical protein ACOX9B_15220 [Candidatus Xenobium sp.]|jgi:hypothetical protein|nr:hypothetical protein [Burkholderiales bacterium]
MNKIQVVAFSACILVATACGPNLETTTPAVPGGGTVSTTQRQGQPRGTVEGGKAHSAKVEESSFSVPFYPGAKVEGGDQHEVAGPEGRTSKMVTAELSTTDPLDKVVEFYSGKLPGANKMDSTVEGQRTVVLVPETPEQGTSVTIDQDEGGITRVILVARGG